MWIGAFAETIDLPYYAKMKNLLKEMQLPTRQKSRGAILQNESVREKPCLMH